MHEYSLVRALVERVEREARERSASRVHRITVKIGPLAGVERDLFASAFEVCRPMADLCRQAELVILDEEVTWQCEVCGAPISQGRVLACTACGWPARLAGGDSLILERLELEVPEHV